MTPYDTAQLFVGEVTERPGPAQHHPLIQWWLSLCIGYTLATPDEVPWCAAFLNGVAYLHRLPRTKSAAARSWLNIGLPVPLEEAGVGHCFVVLKRGTNPALGHCGMYAGHDETHVFLLGGNQSNAVTIARYPIADIVGVRHWSW